MLDLERYMTEADEVNRAMRAMRERYADKPLTPCSLEDEQRLLSGLACWARDKDGRLHMIGSNPTVAAERQLARPSLDSFDSA
jgi:hypothetical protein